MGKYSINPNIAIDRAILALQRRLFKLYGWHPDYPATKRLVLAVTKALKPKAKKQ